MVNIIEQNNRNHVLYPYLDFLQIFTKRNKKAKTYDEENITLSESDVFESSDIQKGLFENQRIISDSEINSIIITNVWFNEFMYNPGHPDYDNTNKKTKVFSQISKIIEAQGHKRISGI